MISMGSMTLELLHRFEHHVCGYLQNKDGLEAKSYVNHIVYSFEDPLFSDWYQSQQEILLKLTFTEFMVNIHSRWLPKCWQQELTCKVRSMKQSKILFSDFIDSLHHDNLLLKGSQFHLSPMQLHTQIESNISFELATAFDHWKDSHKSSKDEAEPANNAAPQANAAVTAAAAAMAATLKVE